MRSSAYLPVSVFSFLLAYNTGNKCGQTIWFSMNVLLSDKILNKMATALREDRI